MIHFKHLLNFSVYVLLATWNIIMIKYLASIGDNYKLSSNDDKFRKTATIISWILFAMACIGGLLAFLELVGILKEEYNMRLL